MTAAHLRRAVTPFVLATLAGLTVLAQSAQQNAADAERLIKALGLHAGSIVGEIGAGAGELTVAIAKVVGDDGRVFSNDLNKDRLKTIAAAAQKAGLGNITVVEGMEAATNLPDGCCDAIFMRDVYHHFRDPASMNASLLASLKPGGRLAIIDFEPPPGAESAAPEGRAANGHHGVMPATIERELKAAGFTIVSSDSLDSRLYLVVARRP